MNYVLYGEEQYRLKRTLQTIIKEYAADEQDLHVIRYDALQTNLDTILEDAQTIPFFAAYKVIVVEHANFLSTLNDTGIDAVKLEAYLKAPNETTVLILCCDHAKLDARKKIVKLLKQQGKVLEFRRLDEMGKESIVKEEIKQRRLQVEPSALQELIRRLPLDMETIQHELDKLELYGDTISRDVVSKLVAKPLEDDVFQLVDAVVRGDKRKAFAIWQDFCVVRIDAIYLIALLAGQFRFLFEVRQLMEKGYGKDAIATQLQAHPYRVKLSMEKASALSLDYLLHMLSKLASLDQKLKSGLLDKQLGFEMFLLELS